MKTNSKYKEGILVDILARQLEKEGYDYRENVPNLNRCADIAAIDKNGKIIIYECKMNDYKKAIEQLKTHRLCADEVYIVTIVKNISQRILSEIFENGIGLILINTENEASYREYNSSLSTNTWNKGRELLRNYIKEATPNVETHLSL